MIAIQGYYDGQTIRPLEDFSAVKNQRVIITIMDEFVETTRKQEAKKSARGILSKYANPDLIPKEEGAWERAVVEKYGNA